MDKEKHTPALRFRGFDSPWEKKKLGDIVDISSGFMGDSLLNNGLYRLTRIETIADGTVNETRVGYTNTNPGESYRLKKGDILYSNINSIDHMGKVAQYAGGTELYHGINLLRLSIRNDINSDFLLNLLNTPWHRKWAQTHANQAVSQASINRTVLASQELVLCSPKEQVKIGHFVHELEQVLFSQEQRIKKAEQFRQALLTKLFPAEGASEPALRFRGFSGPWEIHPLNYYLETSNEKNMDDHFDKKDVLSVSGDFGIVNQIKFQGRSFAGASVSSYGVVNVGDIVYTKSPLINSPYGIIKTNKQIPGIVSTLYAVYHPKETVVPDFVECYFDCDSRLNRYLKPLVNKGAKNDMKVSADSALLGNVIFPNREEQQKIADFFQRLDNFLSLQKEKLEQMRRLKAALLEKLFV